MATDTQPGEASSPPGAVGVLALATLLRHYREAAGLTQEELAERAGLSREAISLLERGARRRPQAYTLRKLAAALALAEPDSVRLAAAVRPFPAGAPPPMPPTAVPAPTLVGRSRELALLERHLTGVGPPVLLLAGEPGIGKSRLLHDAAARAPGYGWTVLHGGCPRRGHGPAHWEGEPYSPLLEAMERYIQGRSPAQLRAELHGCAELVRLLPALAEGSIDPSSAWVSAPTQEHRLMTAPVQARRLLTRAVARFLANVAGPAGTLLILDDLQWAGADALDLLVTLVRSDAAAPLRVVGAYRDTEVQAPQPHGGSHPLAALLADLIQGGLVCQRALAPLRPEDVEQLLDALLEGLEGVSSALRAQVARRAEGVPFYVVSYAQALRLGDREAGAPEAVPWDVAQSIRQRVAALPAVAHEVLGAAAVAGRVVEPAVLLAVVEHPEREVLGALDVAGRAGLLVEDEQGYRFAHDLVREVLEAAVGAARRLLLHRQIATILAQRPGAPPVEQLAYHYGRGGDRQRAMLYLEQAGDRAWAQHANVAAEGYYRDLVEGLEQLGCALDVARARVKLGMVLETTAQHEPALAVLERAAEAYRAADDPEHLAQVLARIGCLHIGRGTPHEGVERLQPVAERLAAREPSYEVVELYASLAALLGCCGRRRMQMVMAERAATCARRLGDDRSLAEALEAYGGALLGRGQLAVARRQLDEAVQRAEAAGDLVNLMAALGSLGELWLHNGELERSRRYCERSLVLAERLGYAEAMTAATAQRGLIAYVGGDWAQARRDGEQALALSRHISTGWAAALPLPVLGLVSYGEGRWEEARGYLEECVTLAPAHPVAAGVLAECEVRSGHAARACARLAALVETAAQEEADVSVLLPTLAWAHLESGDVAAAAGLVGAAITQVRSSGDRLTVVDALRVQALVALRQEGWGAAEQALEEGLALARAMPYPYAEARLAQVYGELHSAMAEPAAAREWLAAALAIYRRLGAHKDSEGVEQAIAGVR